MAAVGETWRIRALARNDGQAESLRSLGHEVVVGDMTDRATLAALFENVDAIYHICPNFHPQEPEIGAALADSAGQVDRLVYHSVLHPQTEAMPHHWRKLRVEELLLKRRAGRVTFLRPAPYVQNLAPYIETALIDGELRMPYSVDSATAMVDLADVGRAAMVALGDGFEAGSGWDLCSIGAITHREVAERLSVIIGRTIEPVQVAAPAEAPPEVRKMFDYMDNHGLAASTGQLRSLIGEPTPIDLTLKQLVDTVAADNR